MLTSTQKCPLRYGCHSVTYTSSFRKASETCSECFISKCRNDITSFFYPTHNKGMQHLSLLSPVFKGKSVIVSMGVRVPLIMYRLIHRFSRNFVWKSIPPEATRPLYILLLSIIPMWQTYELVG